MSIVRNLFDAFDDPAKRAREALLLDSGAPIIAYATDSAHNLRVCGAILNLCQHTRTDRHREVNGTS